MRRFVIALSLVALTLLGSAAPLASAEDGPPISTATLDDPQGDVLRPRGDAVSAQLQHRSDSLTVVLQVATYANPMTNPSWVNGETAATFALDTFDDHRADWTVVLRHSNGHLIGKVVRKADSYTVCSGEGFTIAESSLYGFSFPRTCVNRPARARFFAAMRWDTDPDSEVDPLQVDDVTGTFGPNDNWSRWTYAPCSEPFQSTLEFAVEDDVINAGATARFQVRIRRQSSDIGIRYERLELHRRLEGSDEWNVVDSGRADRGGRITFTDVPPDDAFYRAVHPASSCANDLTTPTIEVTVQ